MSDNPFEQVMNEQQKDDNPFAVAQAEAQVETNTGGDATGFDPFDEPDPNAKQTTTTTTTTATASSNNNNNNTAPAGELASASTVASPVATTSPQQQGQQQGQQQQVQVVQQVVVVQQRGPITNLSPEEAIKMAQLRPGPCCTLHKNEDNKPACMEFLLQLFGLVLTFISMSVDLLATHYSSNIDTECGGLGCWTKVSGFGSDEGTYSEQCNDNDLSKSDAKDGCDLAARGFFWGFFGFVSLWIFGLILVIYLQRDCKFLIVEFPGCKCGKFYIKFQRRHCLYLSIFNWLLVLSQVLLWCVDNPFFDEDKQPINYDIGASIWLNIGTIGVITLGLVHGYYQPEVFSKEPL